MGVQGEVRNPESFTKHVGIFHGKVVAVNPDKEKLEQLLGTTLEKEPEYLSEDDEGNTKLTVSFWLEDINTGIKKPLKFYLKDLPRTSNPKNESDPKKKQFINDVGITTWALKEEDLQDWFTERDYRQAKIGEEELYKFITNWLNKLDTRKKGTTLTFDWKKLMRGNIKEIAEQIGGEYEGNVCCLCTVQTVEKDGEKVEYEKIYNKEFLPGYVIKQVVLKKLDQDFIEAANQTDKKKRTKLQKFVLSVTDQEFGCKDHFILGELREYDPAKNIASPGNNNPIEVDDTTY